jgi:hypothetical protein
MKCKKFIVVLCMITFAFAFSSCNGSDKFESKTVVRDETISPTSTLATSENIVKEETIVIPITDDNSTRYISNRLSRKKPYDTFDALNKVSSNVIEGNCISSKPIFQNNTLYTLSEVRVTLVYKGVLTVFGRIGTSRCGS